MFGRRKNSDVGTVTTTYTETTSRRPSVNYILASLLTLAGAVLLWLCAFSTPFIRSIYYIGLRGGDADRLGTFGYCVRRGSIRCIQKVGYNYPLIPGNPNGLTGSLIITAISAGLASLAFFGLLFAIFRKRGGFPGFILTWLAAFLAVVSFVLALIAFVTLHKRLDRINNGPEYGPALWMHLAGTACLLAAIPFVLLGWIRQRRGKHQHDEVYVAPTPVVRETYVEPEPVRETYVAPVTTAPVRETYVAPTPAPIVPTTTYSPPATAYPEAQEHTTAYRTPENQAVFHGQPITTRYESNYSSTGNQGVTTGYNTYESNNNNSYLANQRTYSGVTTAPLAAPVAPSHYKGDNRY